MQTVYVDVLFMVNLAVNYILLLVTAKICGSTSRRLQLVAAAAFGAFYAAAVVMPGAGFLMHPILKVAVGLLMAMAAFVGQPRFVRSALVFLAVTGAFGGLVAAASMLGGRRLTDGFMMTINFRVLLFSFIGAYALLTLVFRRAARSKPGDIVAVDVRHGERTVHVRALRDTGNALTDPMTGRGVVIAGAGDVRALFPRDVAQALTLLGQRSAVDVLETLSRGGRTTRFQLIPYSAVGVSGGMLLAFRPDAVTIDGKLKSGMLVALSPNSVSESGTYSALVGA